MFEDFVDWFIGAVIVLSGIGLVVSIVVAIIAPALVKGC